MRRRAGALAGSWGTLSDFRGNGWDDNDAFVACKELGYTAGTELSNGNTPDGSGLNVVGMSFGCSTSYATLESCTSYDYTYIRTSCCGSS